MLSLCRNTSRGHTVGNFHFNRLYISFITQLDDMAEYIFFAAVECQNDSGGSWTDT